MIDPRSTSLICPRNDAESATILHIGSNLEMDIHQSQQSTWFCPLAYEPPSTFENLHPDVIIIEMPGMEEENRLRQAGHNVHVIDHHDYHSLNIMRWSPRSSLEQFTDLTGHTLTAKEQIVAWNDQEYIYGLVARNVPEDLQRWVREFDLLEQGYTQRELCAARETLKQGVQLPNGVYCYTMTHCRFSPVIDAHVFAMNGKLTNIWCIGQSAHGVSFFFSGEAGIVRELSTIGGFSKLSNTYYGVWGGHEQGVEAVNLNTAREILTRRR